VRVQAVELRQLEVPMVEPMAAAHGTTDTRQTILVRVVTDESEGWGECVAFHEPTYCADWSNGEMMVMREVLVPCLLDAGDLGPQDVAGVLGAFVGHHTAKCALELAMLDADLRRRGVSLVDELGGSAEAVECVIVVGLFDGDALVRSVERNLERGYQHLKLKVVPGRDLERIDLVRRHFPEVSLRVDGNGTYDWDDEDHRRRLLEMDERGVVCIEQPFAPDRGRPFMELRARVQTPVALDESMTSELRALNALELQMCDVLTIKPGLLGGYLPAKRLHDAPIARHAALGVGGMIETPVARAANLALATLPGFRRCPAEIAPDGRWFAEPLAAEPVAMVDGRIAAPRGPGTGVELDFVTVERLTRRTVLVR